MAVHLPDPQTFGSAFDRYWYAIQGEILRQMTPQFPDEGVWIGFHQGTDVALPIPPMAPITMAAGDHAGPSGFIILSSRMADCYRDDTPPPI